VDGMIVVEQDDNDSDSDSREHMFTFVFAPICLVSSYYCSLLLNNPDM
jgi:hypothetical protein